jgi:hypothetical protein
MFRDPSFLALVSEGLRMKRVAEECSNDGSGSRWALLAGSIAVKKYKAAMTAALEILGDVYALASVNAEAEAMLRRVRWATADPARRAEVSRSDAAQLSRHMGLWAKGLRAPKSHSSKCELADDFVHMAMSGALWSLGCELMCARSPGAIAALASDMPKPTHSRDNTFARRAKVFEYVSPRLFAACAEGRSAEVPIAGPVADVVANHVKIFSNRIPDFMTVLHLSTQHALRIRGEIRFDLAKQKVDIDDILSRMVSQRNPDDYLLDTYDDLNFDACFKLPNYGCVQGDDGIWRQPMKTIAQVLRKT